MVPLRRKLLIALVVALSLAVVAAINSLAAMLPGLVPAATGPDNATQSSLQDCAQIDSVWIDDWLSDRTQAIASEFGPDADAKTTGWSTPGGFPAAALAWAGVKSDCGSRIVVNDATAYEYVVWAEGISPAQFDALSSVLSAMGYEMLTDRVPRDHLVIDEEGDAITEPATDAPLAPEEPVAPVTEEEESASNVMFRVFELRDGGALWMDLLNVDPDDRTSGGSFTLYFDETA